MLKPEKFLEIKSFRNDLIKQRFSSPELLLVPLSFKGQCWFRVSSLRATRKGSSVLERHPQPPSPEKTSEVPGSPGKSLLISQCPPGPGAHPWTNGGSYLTSQGVGRADWWGQSWPTCSWSWGWPGPLGYWARSFRVTWERGWQTVAYDLPIGLHGIENITGFSSLAKLEQGLW